MAAKDGEAEYECRWIAAEDGDSDKEVLLKSQGTSLTCAHHLCLDWLCKDLIGARIWCLVALGPTPCAHQHTHLSNHPAH